MKHKLFVLSGPSGVGKGTLAKMIKERNADIAQTIANFIKSPDKISFQSKQGKEVPLRVLRGDFLRRLTDLLLRLDTTVTLEKSTF